MPGELTDLGRKVGDPLVCYERILKEMVQSTYDFGYSLRRLYIEKFATFFFVFPTSLLIVLY
jgi:hypothetical protein